MLLESFPRIAREQEAILVPLYASLLSSALRPPDASQTGGLGSMPSRAKSSQGKGGAAGSQGSKITLRFARVVESAHLLFSVLGSSDTMTHAQRKQDLDKALPLYRAYCRPYAMHVTRDLATLMQPTTRCFRCIALIRIVHRMLKAQSTGGCSLPTQMEIRKVEIALKVANGLASLSFDAQLRSYFPLSFKERFNCMAKKRAAKPLRYQMQCPNSTCFPIEGAST